MRYIKSRNSFNIDLINESMLYFSPKFRNVINSISNRGNEIAKSLISVEFTDINPDMTFIDSSDKDTHISFSQINNAQSIFDKDNNYSDKFKFKFKDGIYINDNIDRNFNINKNIIGSLYKDKLIFNKSRNDVKLGRLINKIFPGNYDSKSIEQFVNLYKSIISGDLYEFDVVTGDDIIYWYNCDRYMSGNGTLNSSCMADMGDDILEIYGTNSGKINMLILKDNDKLLGRALVWKFDNIDPKFKFEYFMDRIYTVNDSDVDRFKNYASENDWAYRKFQNYNHSNTEIAIYDNKTINIKMKLSIYEDGTYPYMDTFKYLYDDGTIRNYLIEHLRPKILEDTDGGFEGGSMVWSDYYSDEINIDEAVYSDWHGTYIYRSDAIEIDGEYYHQDSDYINYSSYEHRYILDSWSIYSEYLGDYLTQYDSVECILEIEDTFEMVISSSYMPGDSPDIIAVSDVNTDFYYEYWSEEYILLNILEKDYSGNYILKKMSINTYMSIDNNDSYLTIEDAKLMGIGIDKSKYRTTTDMNYILDMINSGIDPVKYLKKLEYMLDNKTYKSQLYFKYPNLDIDNDQIIERNKKIIMSRVDNLEICIKNIEDHKFKLNNVKIKGVLRNIKMPEFDQFIWTTKINDI